MIASSKTKTAVLLRVLVRLVWHLLVNRHVRIVNAETIDVGALAVPVLPVSFVRKGSAPSPHLLMRLMRGLLGPVTLRATDKTRARVLVAARQDQSPHPRQASSRCLTVHCRSLRAQASRPRQADARWRENARLEHSSSWCSVVSYGVLVGVVSLIRDQASWFCAFD